MCPCPFCTTIAILLCPLLLFKGSRKWLKSKIKRHHGSCETCQKAEHRQHLADHTPCHCNACQAKGSRGRSVRRAKALSASKMHKKTRRRK